MKETKELIIQYAIGSCYLKCVKAKKIANIKKVVHLPKFDQYKEISFS